jgi:glycosyltransferase involved in cell wall biosynthesis
MNFPRVSIGLPVYNGQKYLEQTLDSLLNQTFQEFELVISDNASTDGTEEICQARAATDKRIRYYRNASNIGSAPNYRRVFELARGKFFKWCSHDDVCYPDFLTRCLDVFNLARSSLVLVYPRCELINDHGVVLGQAPDCIETKHRQPHRRLARVLRNVSYAYPAWGLIRTDCLRKTRLTGAIPYWDAVLLAELSLYGEIWEIPEVLSQQRCHEENALATCSVGFASEVLSDPYKADRRIRKALRAWTDPIQAKQKIILLPNHEELYWEYLKRVYHTPLPPFDKLLCYLTIPIVCYWSRFRKVGGKYRRKVSATFSRYTETQS